MTLALRLHRLYTDNRRQIRKLLGYPVLLAAGSLGGLALFNRVCFPVLISLIQSFDRNPSGMVLLPRGLSTLFFFLALAGAAGGALAVWLRNPTARLSAYVLLSLIHISLFFFYRLRRDPVEKGDVKPVFIRTPQVLASIRKK